MRWLRLLIALIRARFRPSLDVNGFSESDFTVWITDVDASVMNHAALMTVMEAGRIDFMVRSGFFRLARKNKWYVPSAAISVQFIRPLKLFQKARVNTGVLHVSDEWIYLRQHVSRQGRDIATCIVKSTIKKQRERVNIHEVLKQLGNSEWTVGNTAVIEQFEMHLLQQGRTDDR